MNNPQILEIPEVIFKFSGQINIPPSILNNNTSIIIPSAKYYYVSRDGDKVPVPNTYGTDEEKLLSVQIWYHMNVNDVFPLLTTYAKSRRDQIGRNENNRPGSQIALSMKGQLKQFPDKDDWIYYDRFQLILGQAQGQSLEEFINDFYRFPLNPSADSFMVARLMESYFRDGDETQLRRYLQDKGIVHLANHSFDYYPTYHLFFLLTRFASYPFTEAQIQLSNRRYRTLWGSAERIFIDSIFHYEVYNLNLVLEIIDQIANQGPEKVGEIFGTNEPDWIRWANEYLANHGKTAQGIENLATVNYIVAEKLNSWTDLQIQDLCNILKLIPPFRSEYPTRYAYVADIAVKIQRFKADPASAALWKQQTVESDGY